MVIDSIETKAPNLAADLEYRPLRNQWRPLMPGGPLQLGKYRMRQVLRGEGSLKQSQASVRSTPTGKNEEAGKAREKGSKMEVEEMREHHTNPSCPCSVWRFSSPVVGREGYDKVSVGALTVSHK